ncbi:MAG: pyridoxine 5'-phosphate synthase [Pseudomonadota bacterium]
MSSARPLSRPRLGLNVDHAATLRNARGGAHPDPVRAAREGVAAGADSITVHLREDRRHIRDDDVARLMAALDAPLNLEMAATAEMQAIALSHRPHAVCLVPENRMERTTEGGLDVAGDPARLADYVAPLAAAGCRVSLFIEADPAQVAAAAAVGAAVVELHTGPYCEAPDPAGLARLRAAAEQATRLGLEPHAGHGLDYETARRLSAIVEIAELNIGHFLIGDALFVGLPEAVRRMAAAMAEGRALGLQAAPRRSAGAAS